MSGLRDLEDTRPLPGIEWQLMVDRAQAALFNANIDVVGGSVQLVTNGIYLGEFRPDDAEEEVEIRLRYPEAERNINVLDKLRVNTPSGSVPLSNFVTRAPQDKVDSIQRVDGEYVMFVKANVVPGIVAENKVAEIAEWLADTELPSTLRVEFKGASEEQAESLEFVGFAFVMSLLLMFVLLVTQFNSFYQAFLILSAVAMSTAGVLLGLLTFQQTFSAILTGIGIVALAGIVVNNNIVLIDTFNYLRKENPSMDVASLIIRTGAQRLRPVVLTTVTTILGLLPLATNISIDLINREIVYNSMVSAYWVKLASSIVYGLSFAAVLTLVITPALLIVPQALNEKLERLQLRFKRSEPN
jgi:multidrug efflux pump